MTCDKERLTKEPFNAFKIFNGLHQKFPVQKNKKMNKSRKVWAGKRKERLAFSKLQPTQALIFNSGVYCTFTGMTDTKEPLLFFAEPLPRPCPPPPGRPGRPWRTAPAASRPPAAAAPPARAAAAAASGSLPQFPPKPLCHPQPRSRPHQRQLLPARCRRHPPPPRGGHSRPWTAQGPASQDSQADPGGGHPLHQQLSGRRGKLRFHVSS